MYYYLHTTSYMARCLTHHVLTTNEVVLKITPKPSLTPTVFIYNTLTIHLLRETNVALVNQAVSVFSNTKNVMCNYILQKQNIKREYRMIIVITNKR